MRMNSYWIHDLLTAILNLIGVNCVILNGCGECSDPAPGFDVPAHGADEDRWCVVGAGRRDAG